MSSALQHCSVCTAPHNLRTHGNTLVCSDMCASRVQPIGGRIEELEAELAAVEAEYATAISEKIASTEKLRAWLDSAPAQLRTKENTLARLRTGAVTAANATPEEYAAAIRDTVAAKERLEDRAERTPRYIKSNEASIARMRAGLARKREALRAAIDAERAAAAPATPVFKAPTIAKPTAALDEIAKLRSRFEAITTPAELAVANWTEGSKGVERGSTRANWLFDKFYADKQAVYASYDAVQLDVRKRLSEFKNASPEAAAIDKLANDIASVATDGDPYNLVRTYKLAETLASPAPSAAAPVPRARTDLASAARSKQAADYAALKAAVAELAEIHRELVALAQKDAAWANQLREKLEQQILRRAELAGLVATVGDIRTRRNEAHSELVKERTVLRNQPDAASARVELGALDAEIAKWTTTGEHGLVAAEDAARAALKAAPVETPAAVPDPREVERKQVAALARDHAKFVAIVKDDAGWLDRQLALPPAQRVFAPAVIAKMRSRHSVEFIDLRGRARTLKKDAISLQAQADLDDLLRQINQWNTTGEYGLVDAEKRAIDIARLTVPPPRAAAAAPKSVTLKLPTTADAIREALMRASNVVVNQTERIDGLRQRASDFALRAARARGADVAKLASDLRALQTAAAEMRSDAAKIEMLDARRQLDDRLRLARPEDPDAREAWTNFGELERAHVKALDKLARVLNIAEATVEEVTGKKAVLRPLPAWPGADEFRVVRKEIFRDARGALEELDIANSHIRIANFAADAVLAVAQADPVHATPTAAAMRLRQYDQSVAGSKATRDALQATLEKLDDLIYDSRMGDLEDIDDETQNLLSDARVRAGQAIEKIDLLDKLSDNLRQRERELIGMLTPPAPRPEVARMPAPEPIRFSGADGRRGYLSPDDISPFVDSARRTWQSVWQYYFAQKFKAHPHVVERIAQLPKIADIYPYVSQPAVAKLVNVDEWKTRSEAAMRDALLRKFAQSNGVRDLLINTDDAPLVFESENDAFWGRSRAGVGQNRLGELLMEVRDQLHHSWE